MRKEALPQGFAETIFPSKPEVARLRFNVNGMNAKVTSDQELELEVPVKFCKGPVLSEVGIQWLKETGYTEAEIDHVAERIYKEVFIRTFAQIMAEREV